MTTKRKLSITSMNSNNRAGEIKMEGAFGEENNCSMGTDYMVAKGRLQGVLKLLTEQSDSENSSSLDGDDGYGRKQKRRKLIAAAATGLNNRQLPNVNQSGYRHTYVMKLFDRSVDLAKFEEDTPLYPICRAWMANQPRSTIGSASLMRRQYPMAAVAPPNLGGAGTNSSNLWIGGSASMPNANGDVYRLPAPQGEPPGRAPSPTPEQCERSTKLNINNTDTETQGPPMGKEELIRAHLKRWVAVKRKWIRTATLHEERYAQSKQILQAIYNRAQDTLLE